MCNSVNIQDLLGLCKALFNYPETEEWIESNPFQSKFVRNKLVTQQKEGQLKEAKVIDIEPCDEYFKLSGYVGGTDSHRKHIITWLIMRYCVCHVSEAEGLMWEDIDLKRTQ